MKKNIAVLFGVILLGSILAGARHYEQRTRVIEGTWLWQFEGSDFFEKRLVGRECQLYLEEPSWLDYQPSQIYPSYTYQRVWPSSGTYDSKSYGTYRIEAFEVKFRGRKVLSLFGTGHLGGWNSSYEVDEMIEIRPIPNLDCNVR